MEENAFSHFIRCIYVIFSDPTQSCACFLFFRYAKIISGKISYPETFSNSLEDIIAKLCTKNPSKRLGNMKGTAFSYFYFALFSVLVVAV